MADLPWTWLAIRGSGITAWGLLTAVLVYGLLLRTRLLGAWASPIRLMDMHRWLGVTAVAFLVVHMALLLVDPVIRFNPAQILIPGLAPWQPIAVALGTLAFWALIPVQVVGRLRSRLGKAGATVFKRAHLVAFAAWPLATAHYVMAGTDALADWSLAILVTGTSLIVAGLLARGFFRPPSRSARPATPRAARTPSAPTAPAATTPTTPELVSAS